MVRIIIPIILGIAMSGKNKSAISHKVEVSTIEPKKINVDTKI
jgi:hypothetical protein